MHLYEYKCISECERKCICLPTYQPIFMYVTDCY